MSKPLPAEPVKLAVSILYQEDHSLRQVLEELSDEYGSVDFISQEMPFHYTEYYTKEMGSCLKRRLVFFENPMNPEALPDVKHFTNRIEDSFSVDGKRRINMDPGYVSKAHLILATGKGFTHRPYLRDGIYADLTLVYTGGTFQALPWTYPDYAGEQIIGILNTVRARYIEQLRH
jgi:hypothetical protein